MNREGVHAGPKEEATAGRPEEALLRIRKLTQSWLKTRSTVGAHSFSRRLGPPTIARHQPSSSLRECSGWGGHRRGLTVKGRAMMGTYKWGTLSTHMARRGSDP